MSCWATVSTATEVKATEDEVIVAIERMGFKLRTKTSTVIYFQGGITLSRADEKSPWAVTGVSNFDQKRFGQEVQRAKSLALAKKEGYRVVQDDIQNGKVVLRMKIG